MNSDPAARVLIVGLSWNNAVVSIDPSVCGGVTIKIEAIAKIGTKTIRGTLTLEITDSSSGAGQKIVARLGTYTNTWATSSGTMRIT